MLARADWGTKHVCPSCASRYYDLNQTSYVCPSCGAEPAPSRLPSGGRAMRGAGGRTVFNRRRTATAERPPVAQEAARDEYDELPEDSDDGEAQDASGESEEAAEEKELA